MIKYQTFNHGFWIRIFGRGLSFEIAKHYRPMFSERYGYTKPFYIFGLRIKYLGAI
jgi:hypothetical protein